MAHHDLIRPELLWYKDAIIYELHVRAFYDSNGDGIGDFPGLTQNSNAMGVKMLTEAERGRMYQAYAPALGP